MKPHDRFMDDKEIIKACHRYIAVNHQVMSYGSPPTGLRLFKRAAFPRISDKDSCWKIIFIYNIYIEKIIFVFQFRAPCFFKTRSFKTFLIS